MKRKKVLAVLAAGCLTLGMTSMVSFATEAEATQAEATGAEASYENVVGTSIFVQGYEWGPGIPKIILELANEVSSVSAQNCLSLIHIYLKNFSN